MARSGTTRNLFWLAWMSGGGMLSGCIPLEAGHAPTKPAAPQITVDSIPVEAVEVAPVWAAQQVVANASIVAPTIHIVQPGETLGGIAYRSGVGSDAIAAANGIARPYAIRAGQRLTIPGGRYHIVAAGETGIAIAAAYGVPWHRVVDVNGLHHPYALWRGQRLLLPMAAPAIAHDMEQRAAAFHIDIDDVLTGGQPAAASDAPTAKASSQPRPLPANVPMAQPGTFTGKFAWPIKGPVLSRFGPGQSGAKNNGIDIGASVGTPIRATANGIVAYAGDKVAVFGGLVLISHGSGWVSAYGHASRVDVVRGQKVIKGQLIALTGDTGYANQPKLHFELRKDRMPVNPNNYLPKP